MIGYYNPAVAAYNYNLGTQMAISNFQAAQIASTPVFGAGDSVPINMDYPICPSPVFFGYPCYPLFAGVGMGAFALGNGLGSVLASPFRAIKNTIDEYTA